MAAGASVVLLPKVASAFCGFYVGGADAALFNNATQVVMMREGTRTVLSMQNDYQGPPDGFAMVVPVPVVLDKSSVKTLPKTVFERIDKLTAPRLVEYWEQDPCAVHPLLDGPFPMAVPAAPGMVRAESAASLGVRVEAQFSVDEYDIVILSAKDSSGLDTWLRQEKYKIPAGAEPYLRPYVQAGSKFFVAKVDGKKVKIEHGHAALSPLRFHYDTNEFSLPVRLGLINSSGTQDLIVNILAKGQRYEPTNYPSVTIPTNLDIAEDARANFGRFYAALFDETVARNKGAVVTEYAWDASTCDPCPGPALMPQDFATLGGDAMPGPLQAIARPVDMTPPPPPPPPPGGGNQGPRPVAPPMTPPAMAPMRPPPPADGMFYASMVVQTCWQQVLAAKPKTKTGRLEVRVTPKPGGPAKVEVLRNDTGEATLTKCLTDAKPPGTGSPQSKPRNFAFALTATPMVSQWGWTITRLHARYTKDALGPDIVFRAAPAISGGREVRNGNGELEHGSSAVGGMGGMNNFQGRYAIRHPWTGPMTCASPRRGQWGGPPGGGGTGNPVAADNLAFVPRGNVPLVSWLKSDVPELGVKVAKEAPAPVPAPSATAPREVDAGSPAPPPADARGCHGCTTAPASSGLGALAGVALVASVLARRGNRRRR